jgi:hypothetical protein
MKFTATIAPGLLKTLGTTEACESKLKEVLEAALWSFTLRKDQTIRVVLDEDGIVQIDLDLFDRDVEVIKDWLYESLTIFFDSDFYSDVNVEINNEL